MSIESLTSGESPPKAPGGTASGRPRRLTAFWPAALGQWLREHALELGFVAALTVLYSALGIRRHLRLQTAGYDLGIFEQAIRNYAAFRPPVADLKGPGFNLLGDHFHPILTLLAPVYAAFPTPITLIVAQAFLFALASAPLVAWARRALGTGAAVAIGLIYGLSFGLASAVGFDFHEIAFAVPLLAFSLGALGQGRLGQAAGWAIPLVLVKEDLGIAAVAVIGALILLRGARRLGVVTMAIGVGATLLEVLVLLPLVNSSGTYDYWKRLDGGRSFTAVALDQAGVKIETLVITLGITAFAALFSPLVLVAVPTIVWRFVSDDTKYWGTGYHYSAVLMPILVAALIETLSRWRAESTPRSAWRIRSTLAVSLAVTALLIPSHALSQLLRPALWQPNPRISAVEAALARIPDGATVAASDNLVPQLTDRATVTLFGLEPLATVRPDWIIVDPHSTRHFRVTRALEQRALTRAKRAGYVVVLQRDDIELLSRSAPTGTLPIRPSRVP